MAKKTHIDVTASINRITGKQDKFKQIVSETEAFFDMIANNPAEIKIANIKSAIGGLQQVRDECERINSDINSDHGQIEFANTLLAILGKAEGQFENIGVMFQNVNNNAKSYARGLSDIVSHLNDDSFGVKFLDIGGKFGELQDRAEELFSTLKSIGKNTTLFGRFSFDTGILDKGDLADRITALRELRDVVFEMASFDPTMKSKDFVGGLDLNSLDSAIRQSEADLAMLAQLRLRTTDELRERRRIITEIYDAATWDNWEHTNAKDAIHDDDVYNDAIKDIDRYIEARRNAIEELRVNEHSLFSVDGISEYVDTANAEIDRLTNLKKELQDLRARKSDNGAVVGDFSGVVTQLEAIKEAVVEIKDAFKPLTDALSNEDSALSAMVKANINDLELLNIKIEEVFSNIRTLSEKNFNVTNLIADGSKGNAELDQIRQFRKEAKLIFDQVQELYTESMVTGQKLSASGMGKMQVLDFAQTMAAFDMKDLAKRIKNRSANSLGVVIDELNEWKKVLLQFNNLRNNVEAGSFNINKYSDTSSKVRIGSKTTDEAEKSIVDRNDVDNEDILNKIKTLSEQVESELNEIRVKMSETFDFSTIDPKTENIKTVIENIYNQFVQLQADIKKLDFTIESNAVFKQSSTTETPSITSDNEGVKAASDAIIEEGKAAKDATISKKEFIDANKHVAESGAQTKEGISAATEAIQEEGEAAQSASEQIKQALNSVNNSVGKKPIVLNGTSYEDFQSFAMSIAARNDMQIEDVSVVADGDDKARLATIKMENKERAESIVYTYRLSEAEDGVTTALLERYKASNNISKSLRTQVAAEKKLAAEAKKKAKEQAQNNEWLIKQQAKLDTQERRYKNSNKPIDGATTAVMSTETSLGDDATRTIDSLTKHIRERIKNVIGGQLSDNLKEEILNDIRILQNEIAVAQNNQYSATNMRASSVITNKKAYEQYLNAFEANAKKSGVYDKMVDIVDGNDVNVIQQLRSELQAIGDTDSAAMDAFVDNVKIAIKRLQAEKAKAAEASKTEQNNQKTYDNAIKSQEKLYKLKKQMVGLDPQSSKGQETIRKLSEAQDEYNEALSKTNRHLLTIGQLQDIDNAKAKQEAELSAKREEYKAKITDKQDADDLKYFLSLYKQYTDSAKALKKIQGDTTGKKHDAAAMTAIANLQKAKQELAAFGIDVNDIAKSELLTETQKARLLEEQVKYKKQIKNLSDQSADKAATAQQKANQKYVNSTYNKEAKYNRVISDKVSATGDDVLSSKFLKQIQDYNVAYSKLQTLATQIANSTEPSEDLKEQFQGAATEVEKIRQGILGVFNAGDKLDNLTSGTLLKTETIDESKLTNLKAAMLEFGAAATDGKLKFTGFNAAGTEMYGVLDKGASVVERVTIALKDGTNQLYAYKSGTQQVGNSWSKLGDSLKSGIKSIVIRYMGISEAVQAVRKGVTYVKEIDVALTELKKVTDETEASYNKFLQTMSQAASRTGSTVKDLTTSAADWARLGYTMEQAGVLAENTSILMNVSEFDNINNATDTLVSALQAFKAENGDVVDLSMEIINKYNEIGNSYAISTSDLANSLTRSSATLVAAGNTLSESIAMTTAANATIQDPNAVGNALKVVAMRIRGTTATVLEEMGEDTEGLIESTSKLQAKIQALTNIDGDGGINILADDGSYKSTYEILVDISKVFDKIDDKSQAALLELLAGKQRGSVVAAILQNGEMLEDVYASAEGAENSAMHELETHLESIQGRIDLFNNSLQTMWMNFIDSKTVKSVVDFGTQVVKFLDTVPGKITAIITALTGIAKFKGFSLMGLGKDALKSLQNLSSVPTSLQGLKTLFPTNGQIDATAIQAYATAVSNLTAKQQAAMLSTTGLSKAQIQLALQYNGLSDDVVREATAHLLVKSAQDQEKLSSQELFTQRVMLSAASLKLKTDEDSLAASKWLEANATKAANAEELQALILKSDLSAASKAAAIAAITQSGANMTLGTSFKALGIAIKTAFASNPIGFLITAATTILSIVIPAVTALVDKFHKSAEEIRAEVEELTASYEEAKKTISGNLEELSESSDSSLYATLADEFEALSKGVDKYGNNISLTTDQYQRYKEICEKIVGINPEIARGYDSATKAIGNNASALAQLIELQKMKARIETQEYLSDENLNVYAENAYNKYSDAHVRQTSLEKGGLEYFGASADIARQIKSSVTGTTKTGQDWTVYDSDLYSLFGLSQYYDFSMGNSMNANRHVDLVDEHYKEIYEKLKEAADKGEDLIYTSATGITYSLSAIDVKNIANNLGKYIDEYNIAVNNAKNEVKKTQDELIQYLLVAPTSLETYDNLNDGSKSLITEWIKKSSIFKINSNDKKAIQNQLESSIELIKNVVNDFGSEVADIEYNGQKFTANELFEKVADFDLSSMTYDEYVKEMDKVLKALYFSWDEATRNAIAPNGITDLGLLFGIDFQANASKRKQITKTLSNYLDTTRSDIAEQIDTLSAEQFNAMINIDWNAIGVDKVKSWKDVLAIINSELSKTSNAGVKTYSAIASSLETHNEILAQTQEIIINNTQVTQEYKDSLKELGISETDLAKCFDENNKLVVTNAKLLNNLVKNAKSVALQNTRLAKSQAMLQYNELYKKIRVLTNGEAKLAVANREQIEALYAEMGVLQKTIAKYSLLETELLGTTSAYTKFQEAQDADSQTDYIGSMSEMVAALGEAFNKATLGSETAQAAIMGLVPESVYEDLDTVDEKMAAIYDYFKSGPLSQYFNLEFDDDGNITSAEMLLGNLRTFIEAGMGNIDMGELTPTMQVFEGADWQHFELSDAFLAQIDSLPEGADKLQVFANAMGVTKDVALAFLKSLEDHDAEWIDGDYTSLLDYFSGLESKIYNTQSSLTELDVKLAQGKITSQEYAAEYAKLSSTLAQSGRDALNQVTQYQDLTNQINAQKTAVDEATAAFEKYKAAHPEMSEDDLRGSTQYQSLLNASALYTELIQKREILAQPTEFLITFAMESIEEEFKERVDFGENGEYTVKVGIDLSEEELATLENYKKLCQEQYKIETDQEQTKTALEQIEATAQSALDVINSIDGATITIDTSSAVSNVNALARALLSLPTSVSAEVETTTPTTTPTGRNTRSGNTVYVNGTAHASGDWGVPTNEHNALLGELGPELVNL